MIARLSYQTDGCAIFHVAGQTLRGNGLSRYNIAPGQQHSVIIANGNGLPVMEKMTWGRALAGAAPKYDLAGVDVDGIGMEGLPVGQHARHRCIVPADGVYVWERRLNGEGHWYFSLRSAGGIAMLGVWIEFRAQADFPPQKFFTVLHVKFPRPVGGVCEHFPIVVGKDQLDSWVDETATPEMLSGYLDGLAKTQSQFHSWEVSPYVKALHNDGPLCNKPQNRGRFTFDARGENPQAPTPMAIRLFSGRKGLARPSWVEVQRRVAKSIIPFEGGRADGNRAR